MIKKRLTTESDEDSDGEIKSNDIAVKFRRKGNNKSILVKLFNRSQNGYFNKKSNVHTFNHIPNELRFCLKDIIPFCYLSNHIFMGLTDCGNFFISYKRFCCESESYDFNSGYKYELFFWIFKPHNPLERYYKVSLFDDHAIEDIKSVTMTQWKSNPNTIIVHGSSEIDDQHSYASIIRIPKLGCFNCKKLRECESSDDNLFKNYDLCIKCNLTIHTKYRFNESTQKFQPKIHLNAVDYVIMCENSLIHTINVRLDMQQQARNVGKNFISQKYLVKATCDATKSCHVEAGQVDVVKNFNIESSSLSLLSSTSSTDNGGVTKPISIVEQILKDFSEFDSEYSSSSTTTTTTAQPLPPPPSSNVNAINNNNKNEVTKNGCEDKITLNINVNDKEQPKNNNNLKKTESGESSSRLIKKKSSSYAPSSPEILEAAAKTYEFSEENEKCEKISIFRKRRLADKKYEFSEENTENIIPFNRIRNKISKRTVTLRRSSPHPSFLSPCGSPISSNSRHLMSPPGFRSPNYYTYRSSPTYNFLYSPPPSRHFRISGSCGSMSPASGSEDIHKYFSDIMNRMKDNRIESGNESHDESIKAAKDSPVFSKKIVHNYMEEDDANSVVTCEEEDDCISPGYHARMVMEVHGSCYSKMQIVSKKSLNRLKGHPRAIITQNSFDIETFSIHIANLLCKKNDKKYGILFDLAFEIVHVCPLSQMVICALCLQFTASDFDRLSQCLNCSNESDCFMHRRLYETTVLFSWKMTCDEYKILDSGQLKQISAQMKLNHPIRGNRQEMLIRKLQRFIRKIFGKDRSFFDQYDHLKILDCNEDKSKDSITDYKNGIEFYRRQPFDSPSSISSMSESSASGSSDSESCDESLQ